MTRAKFYVFSKTENKGSGTDGNGFQVELKPVMDGSEENKQFYKWSPGGSITLVTINENAATYLEVGKEYYVDFTQA